MHNNFLKQMENLTNKELFEGVNDWRMQFAKNGFLHLLYVDTPIGNRAYAPARLLDEIEKRFNWQAETIERLKADRIRLLNGSLDLVGLLIDGERNPELLRQYRKCKGELEDKIKELTSPD